MYAYVVFFYQSVHVRMCVCMHAYTYILTIPIWQKKLLSWAKRVGCDVQRMITVIEGDENDALNWDRQLCAACHHICHMAYVELEGNKNTILRACPEHSEYLGHGEQGTVILFAAPLRMDVCMYPYVVFRKLFCRHSCEFTDSNLQLHSHDYAAKSR
jgi:hypothetical protein